MRSIDKKREPATRVIVFLLVATALAFITVAASVTDCFSLLGEPEGANKLVTNVSMKIISPGWTISYMNVNTNNATVANLLFECADHYNFDVETEYWTGYDSFFIESINGTKNGEDNRYWQYYVNGEYADAGCSRYVLNDNDVVEWRFESSAWGS